MPGLQPENFGDLLKTTLADLGEPNFTDIMTDLQDYPAAKTLIKRNMMNVQAGFKIQWDVAVNFGDQAENVATTDFDSVTITDGMTQASVPWRKTKSAYAFYHEELSMNKSPRRIVDLIKFRRLRAMVSWVEKMENNFWTAPLASDTRTPYGLPYWCTKNATEGFNGGILSGFSNVADLSPTTYARWNNWTAQYTNLTLDDFVRKARNMATKTGFKPAVDGIPTFNTGDKNEYHCNYAVRAGLEEVVDSRNENIGNDIAKYDDGIIFRRIPVRWVPILDADTTNPFYQINWGVFKVIVLSGWWMKETNLEIYPGQRNVTAVFQDSIYNFVCRDRRRLGVLATGTTYPS